MQTPLSSPPPESRLGSQSPSPNTTTPGSDWTVRRFFTLLGRLGRLRVISICGPSVFESLCEAGPFSIEDGSMNMVTNAFHWHVDVSRFRHLRACDTLHARSGRNVLFFELRESADSTPFLRIYVYRAPGVDFDPAVAAAFQSAHGELAAGVLLTEESA